MQQRIKWTVYTLLLVNFAFYFLEDWSRAGHIIVASSTLLDWAGEFATSIDEAGWFFLLAMFELETYVLTDQALKGWVSHAIRTVRLLCYAMIAHNVYALAAALIALQPTVPVEGISDPCELTNESVSFVYNLEYTAIDDATCAGLPQGTAYYQVADNAVVSTLDGLTLERRLAWVDLIEALTWLLVLAAIEASVRMQSLGKSVSRWLAAANGTKAVLYVLLISLGTYWATLGHWLYFWDELLWIGGFKAIDMNLDEWRDEMVAEKLAHVTTGSR